jgi:hypothetical protein
MKSLAWTTSGVALGVLYVLLTGMLSIQTIGVESGAVFDLNNELVSVTAPKTPVLSTLATALLGGLVFYTLAIAGRKRSASSRVCVLPGFIAASTLLVIWSFFITSDVAPEGVPSVGIALGWEGWVQQGGTNPAVHLLILLTLGALWEATTSWSKQARDLGDGSRATNQ